MLENLVICWIIGVGLLALYGLCCLFGLGIVKVWDRKRRKHKWYLVGRCL